MAGISADSATPIVQFVRCNGSVVTIHPKNVAQLAYFSDLEDVHAYMVQFGDQQQKKRQKTESKMQPTEDVCIPMNHTLSGAEVSSNTMQILLHIVGDADLPTVFTNVDFTHVERVLSYLGGTAVLTRRAHKAVKAAYHQMQPESLCHLSAFAAFNMIDPQSVYCQTIIDAEFRPERKLLLAKFALAHGDLTPCYMTIPSPFGRDLKNLAARVGVPPDFLRCALSSPNLAIAGGAAMLAGCSWLKSGNSDVDVFVLAGEPLAAQEAVQRLVLILYVGFNYVVTVMSDPAKFSIVTCLPPVSNPNLRAIQFIKTTATSATEILNEFDLQNCRAALVAGPKVQASCGAIVAWKDRVTRASSHNQVSPKRLAKLVKKGFALSAAAKKHLVCITGSDVLKPEVLDAVMFGHPRIPAEANSPRERDFILRQRYRLHVVQEVPYEKWVPMHKSGHVGYGSLVTAPVDMEKAMDSFVEGVDVNDKPVLRNRYIFVASRYCVRLPVGALKWDMDVWNHNRHHHDKEYKETTSLKLQVVESPVFKKLCSRLVRHVWQSQIQVFGERVPRADQIETSFIRVAVTCLTDFYREGVRLTEVPKALPMGTRMQVVGVPEMFWFAAQKFEVRFKAKKVFLSSVPIPSSTTPLLCF